MPFSCGLPSERVSESCWLALERESRGQFWGKPSTMQRGAPVMKRKERGENKERGYRKKREEDMEWIKISARRASVT